MKVYDLSGPIENGADWYNEPGSDPVELRDIGSLEKEGWISHTLNLMVLNGTTYMETSAHLFADRPTIDKIPPSWLIIQAFIVHLPATERILPLPKQSLADFRCGKDALLLACGWDAHWNQPDFYKASPYFSKSLQNYILDLNPAILGGDMVSFDHPDDTSMPFLHAYFEKGGMIITPLYGLTKISSNKVTLYAVPLRLVGASAAPCRVLAW